MKQENATNMLSTLGRCCVVRAVDDVFCRDGRDGGAGDKIAAASHLDRCSSRCSRAISRKSTRSSSPCACRAATTGTSTSATTAATTMRPAERAFGKYPDGESLRGYGDGGRLCRLNLRTGELRTILDDPQGGVRDPQMHYDGKKILFSYRRGGSPTYHLYEINIDGTGLTQLTDDGPDDDIEPVYLPDGGIMFVSSRCRRFVNCWYTRVAHALPLRRRRGEHPHRVEQQRSRQHALGAARRTHPLHALGVRRSVAGPLPPSLDGQPRRHGPDDLLRQPVRRHGHARRQADPGHEQDRGFVFAGAWPPRASGARDDCRPEDRPGQRGGGEADRQGRLAARSARASGRGTTATLIRCRKTVSSCRVPWEFT